MLGRIDLSLLGPPVGQALTPRVNEGEAFRVTMRVLNADLGAATPTTMRWYLRDLDRGGEAIIGWQDLTPATSVNVTIAGSRNLIRNTLSRERRQLVFEATDSDGPIRKTLDYEIQSLGLGSDGEPILSEGGEEILSEN